MFILYLKAPLDATNLLKIKQSELRLYCDLLTQQTHDLKNLIVQVKNTSNETSNLEVLQNNGVDIPSESFIDSLKISSQNNQKSDQVSLSSSFKSMDNYSENGTIEPEVHVESSINDRLGQLKDDDNNKNIKVFCISEFSFVKN